MSTQIRAAVLAQQQTLTSTMKIREQIRCLFLCLVCLTAVAFVPSQGARQQHSELQMGLFDGIMKAFGNEEFAAPAEGIRASARHILVKSPEEVQVVLSELDQGSTFPNMAAKYSTCPSRNQGGSLGSFRPGQMVSEFDAVIFDPDTQLNQVVGPVQTKFGYHLIVVEKRTGIE